MTRARSLSQLANSSVFTVATNNRVGIGSEVPTAKLDVDGTLNVSGNATIGGVATYEDVTNVDSVGIVTARSGVSVPDGQKILLGTSNDLEIFHDGTDSIIDNNTGDLYLKTTGSGDDIIIRATDDVIIQTQGSEGAVIARGNGTVELYYDGSKKFETTSAGVSITGAGTFTGNLTVNNQAQIYRTAAVGGSTSGNTLLMLKSDVGGTAVAKAFIDTDGAASFAGGDLTINSSGNLLSQRSGSTGFVDLNSTGILKVRGAASGSVFTIENSSTNAATVSVLGNGSATFAAGALAISATGNLSVNRTAGTNDVFNGKLNGSVT